MPLALVESTPVDSSNAEITDQEAGALARAVVTLFQRWQLTDNQCSILLGGMSASTWSRWKAGNAKNIGRDLRTRMSVLMGIHKGLRYLFSEPARRYAWIQKPNTAFGGKSALDIMLLGDITDLIDVRAYIDAERGAW